MQQAEKYVWFAAKRYECSGIEAEDLRQEIRVAIWQSLDRFDESKSEFDAWASNIAKYRAIDIVRTLGDVTRTGRPRRVKPISLVGLGCSYRGDWAPWNPEDPVQDSDTDWRDLAEAVFRCSREVQWAWLYHSGILNMREIAEAYGVTESRVCQILKRGHWRPILRRLLLGYSSTPNPTE